MSIDFSIFLLLVFLGQPLKDGVKEILYIDVELKFAVNSTLILLKIARRKDRAYYNNGYT